MIYYTLDEALNFPKISEKLIKSVVTGLGQSCQFLSEIIGNKIKSEKKNCIIAVDGFIGVEWKNIISGIRKSLEKSGLSVRTIDISSFYKSPEEIENMVNPYLNSDNTFGVVYKGKLKDFFNVTYLKKLKEKLRKNIKSYKTKQTGSDFADVTVVYGCGAFQPFLKDFYDFILYLDITLDELLKLFEKSEAFPLGSRNTALTVKSILKRFTYVDYKILNEHKKDVLKCMDWYIEANDTRKLILLPRNSYDQILTEIAQYPLRLQPIYIPRVWGGKYLIKIRNLPLTACAFSLEVYAPLQNIRISLGDIVVKIPFLNVLWDQPVEILGNDTIKKFGVYFPLTANYDDTFNGGSLAIQVHPHGKYMREKFNEKMRHDETYYAVKVWPGAKTYLGLKEETDMEELRDLSRKAEKQKIQLEHDKYINSFKSEVGDLFLIPSGTVHASGANQLILELDFDGSSIGAEYTFHIYDYLRLDLEGKLRSIHLDHAFNVIRPFERTNWVKRYLKQQPRLLRKGYNWAEYVLGSRNEMFYQVDRLELQKKIEDNTKGKFHILTLVEGESILVRSNKYPERKHVINCTETLVIPACLGSYTVINKGKSFCKITKSFLK